MTSIVHNSWKKFYEGSVGNMMQSVVLDGNPLDRVLSLNGNPLDEVDGNLLDEIVLDGICLDDLVK